MSETNYLEIIQNKLDALVEKIVQKENSDEDFRITYAQILEKINTKMDLFSGGDNLERLGLLSVEIKKMLVDRQEVVDSKFNAIKAEFENINDVLLNSLKTPELLASFNTLQNQIHYFSEEQENQKATFNSIISHIEKFGTLEETNELLRSNFAIVKEQNTIVNETVNKHIKFIDEVNELSKENNAKFLEKTSKLLVAVKEFETLLQDNSDNVKEFLSDKVSSVIEKIHETDSFLDVLNTNVTTLVQVVGNIFEDEEFKDVQSDVADVLVKTSFISETLKNMVTKDEFTESIEANKELLQTLEQKISEDVISLISEKSSATQKQIEEISFSIEVLKNDISNIVLNEHNEQVNNALNNLQAKFVTQLVQIADNINFADETDEICESLFDCTDELKEKISSDISGIKEDILQLQNVSFESDNNIINLLEKIDDAVNTNVDQDLKTLISGFKLLTSGLKEDLDYVYTLPDIESDLANIRTDLSNLKKSIEDSDEQIVDIKSSVVKIEHNPINTEITEVKGLFDNLNEDISSISKRTNKLILTSDEINKTLKANIEAFSSLLNTFERQSKEFYNSRFLTNLDIKVDNVFKTTTTLVQSDKVLNEAFMYLAEWVDTASESFENIKSEIAEIKGNSVSETVNLSEKLDSVDDKLNRLMVQQNETKELKSVIEYIAQQVSIANEKLLEQEKTSQKILTLEKQLRKIEKNVVAITDYLDDDDYEDD